MATFTVNPLPANPGNPTSNSPQCNPPGVTLTRTGTPPAGETWYWQTVAGGTNTTNSGATFVATTGGTYYLRAQNNTTGCWSAGSGSVAVTITPTLSTAAATPNPTNTATGVCYSGTGAVTSISWGAVAGATSYDVYFGAGSVPATVTANVGTNTYNTGALAANTTYYWRIVAKNACGDASTSATFSFTTSGSPCYCASSGSTFPNGISGVNFNTINNLNTAVNVAYSDYTYLSTSIVKTLSYNLRVFVNTGGNYTDYQSVYIDWNGNGSFADAGEFYSLGTATNVTNGLTSLSPLPITVPAGAITGSVRMRIQSRYGSATTGPCQTGFGFDGEVEDYTINVLAPAACAGTPNAGTTTTTPNTGWPGSPYTVIATGYSIASNLTFQWQFSTDAGATWTNAGAATSTYANYNAVAPASGIVHWRLVVTCTNSSQTATSTTGIFTTMAVSNVVTGCPNVVSGGLGLNGADPAPFDCTAASTCVDLEATYLDLGNTTSYIVEPILYNPPFAFSGLANPVSVNTDDVWSPIVPLPFKFCFYGNTYEQCLIGSNGVVTFDLVNNSPGGTCGWSMYDTTAANLPVSGHGALIENAIFGVFHDINPTSAGNVGWELITLATGCRALVVSWSNVPMYSNDTANDYTGMMVLYENSNIIEVYVQKKRITTHAGFGTEPMWNDGNAVIGIQNANGTLASVPPGRNVLDPNWTTTNEAWRFVPNGTSIASIAWYEGPTASGPVLGTNDILNVCPTATTTYTAEITYTLCDGRTIKETDTTTVTVNGAKTWNGSVNTDWNVANNWTPVGVPTAMDCVVIADTANDPIISGTNYNGLGLNLTVNNNATLTVTPNNDLTITEWVNINPTGDLVLQNSASLIQVNNTPNQGTMHMTRTANIRKLDYVYWSSPVSSFASSAISPGTPTWAIYKWTPTIPTNTNFFGNWASGNETMALGKGYIVRGPDSFTATLAPFNAVFAGTPNNGIITTPISRGTWNGGTYSTGVSTTLGTNDDDNWNLIGNPYPSAVRAIDFLTLNTNIDGFIKIWTHGTLPSSAIADPFYNNYVYNYTPGDYITYNSSGTSSGPGVFNGNIAAGQGFFVLMKHTSLAASENVTFNNSMRSSTYDNAQFFRTSNENGRIWLDLVASNGTNIRNLVAYTDGASNDRDRLYDAITDEKLNLNLYSLIGETPMTIQGRTLPFDQNDRVPMGVKIPQDGNYSIAIGVVDGFFTDANQEIYLEDKATNVIHNLRDAPYNFTSVAGNHANRFILRYTNETLGNDDVISDEANLWVISSDILSVKSTKNTIQSVRVFDVLGRHLAYYPNVDGYEVPLTTIQKNNAGLIIQVTLSNGAVISKKAIY